MLAIYFLAQKPTELSIIYYLKCQTIVKDVLMPVLLLYASNSMRIEILIYQGHFISSTSLTSFLLSTRHYLYHFPRLFHVFYTTTLSLSLHSPLFCYLHDIILITSFASFIFSTQHYLYHLPHLLHVIYTTTLSPSLPSPFFLLSTRHYLYHCLVLFHVFYATMLLCILHRDLISFISLST